MFALLGKLASSLRNDGAARASRKVLAYCLRRAGLGTHPSEAIYLRQLELAKELDLTFGSTVRYGPFAGLKLATESSWSNVDKGSKLLGLYEREVLDSLTSLPRTYRTFIDLGAADGYYGIGVLIGRLFDKSYCFEMSEMGRASVSRNASLNHVSDRVIIRGKADRAFYNEVEPEDLKNSVLFIDIEGAEFDLLDHVTFEIFRKSVIFVELHDWFFKDGPEKLRKLKSDSSATHMTTALATTGRDLSKFDELKNYCDNDRWLICSENRGRLMTWWRFDPIESN